MKIVYFFQYFATREMSGITRTYEFTRRLAAKGHEVHVITTWHRGGRPRGWHTTNEDGVHVHWLTLDYDNKMGFLRRLLPFVTFALRAPVRGFRIAKGADLLYASSGPLTIVLPALFVSVLRRIPYVLEVRDVWPDTAIAVGALKGRVVQWATRLLEKIAYARATHIVAASPGMKVAIVRKGVASDKVDILPNSSDLDLFGTPEVLAAPPPTALARFSGRPIVAYTGTLGRANGVASLVDIAAAAARRGDDTLFLTIGGGMEAESIARKAREAGVLERNFFMMDPVPKADMPALLARIDLSLTMFQDLPALWDSSPNKFFDALASHKPVAINYAGWKKTLIEDRAIGLVLPSDDPEAAARMIAEFLGDEARLAEAGRNARRLAETDFDRDRLAEHLERILLDSACA